MTTAPPTGTRETFVGECRVCAHDPKIRPERRSSTLRDDTGPVHLCCARLPDGATSCTACRTAQVLDDDWLARGKRHSAARARAAARIVAAGD